MSRIWGPTTAIITMTIDATNSNDLEGLEEEDLVE